MKVTVLGCGSSPGVPAIQHGWGDCDPSNPRNRRTRVSVYVEQGDTAILIDTSPDLRQQALDNNIKKIDAVLYTHAHADHCHGIDELRSFKRLSGKLVDIYAAPDTLVRLQGHFPYIFKGEDLYKPSVAGHEITDPFAVGGIQIKPFTQDHGDIQTLGFRLGDFAYSTDLHALDEAAFDALRGIKIWVVDCVREKPHPTHSHLEQTLQWIERVKPDQAYLTHMNHTLDYDALAAKLPSGVRPAHDGLIIDC
ncbi:MAG: MBL fold metallo-hydrolase [Alphaproteobacteria bacterium]|nr:MBL fold metallo-hydrolase [Alphaproteobacteria bacterium]